MSAIPTPLTITPYFVYINHTRDHRLANYHRTATIYHQLQ